MEFSDIYNWAQKLSSHGTVEHLENGKEAVPVSLMITDKINEKSREARKQMLMNTFSAKLASVANGSNIEIDFNSISTSAQTIQAKLGIDDLHFLVNTFKQQNLEIYPNDAHTVTE